MVSFSDAIARGALGSCKIINLGRNRIGDAGLTALADAVRSGAMAALELVAVFDNPGDISPVKVACDARGIKCPSNVQELMSMV